MANYVYCSYTLKGSEEAIAYVKGIFLLANIKAVSSLYSFVKAFGKDPDKMDLCRGFISHLDASSSSTQIEFSAEYAWRDSGDFADFLLNLYPGIEMYYFYEGENNYYETNDLNCEVYTTRYVVDSEKEGIEYFDSLEDVSKYIFKLTNKKCFFLVKSIKTIIDEYTDHSDNGIIFSEVQINTSVPTTLN